MYSEGNKRMMNGLLMISSRRFLGLFEPADEVTAIYPNADKYLPVDTA